MSENGPTVGTTGRRPRRDDMVIELREIDVFYGRVNALSKV